MRREFHFTEDELDRLSPREAVRYLAYLHGLSDAAAEQNKNARK